ncbi:hypothetical protein LCGC14_2918950 [marine sediment metagenome]|uniref:DUF559 domain-containing protein n=1 Tax=marine sediment metagenome TaxID=412755 RepID=A0A0F8ZX03_9ZZZZ
MSPASLVSKSEDYTIQGSKATDIEWRVAMVLERLGLDFKYQYPLEGGRTKRGGIVLDFLVLTDPLRTPLDIRGDYWHQPRQRVDDDLGLALAMSRGRFAEPVIIYGGELQTMEQAYSTVKRKMRV